MKRDPFETLDAEVQIFEEPKNLSEKYSSSSVNLIVKAKPTTKRSDPKLAVEVENALQLFKNRSNEVPQELVDLLKEKKKEERKKAVDKQDGR